MANGPKMSTVAQPKTLATFGGLATFVIFPGLMAIQNPLLVASPHEDVQGCRRWPKILLGAFWPPSVLPVQR